MTLYCIIELFVLHLCMVYADKERTYTKNKQSHINAMLKLTQTELKTLRDKLPDGGYKLVASKLTRVTAETVRKVLSDPARYKREVIDAAIEVVKEQKELLAAQREAIKEIAS
jgi:hypothetical protein